MKCYTIPVFVPELACPNRCVFCNQHSISGCHHQPSPAEVRQTILRNLESLPCKDSHVEVGFFGGSFTGIEKQLQSNYLSVASHFLNEHMIDGIRLSTRPDYINVNALELLKEFGVTTIELGAQSLDEEVLRLSGRGHTVNDVQQASKLILEHGFNLGLQMMTGLPGDTIEKSIHTARTFIELGATDVRIYPTLVIKGTQLEQHWINGNYQPQSLDDAVNLTASLLEIFRQAKVNVIRVGLHPSEDLLTGKEMLAGPFHVSFKQLAETELWRRKLTGLIAGQEVGSIIKIEVPAEELNHAIGYKGSNRSMLLEHFSSVEYITINDIDFQKPVIITDKRLPLPAKNSLKRIGNLYELSTEMVYKSISGHPDIFICGIGQNVVHAPSLDVELVLKIKSRGYNTIAGSSIPGKTYPSSARYNAVVTADSLIHNLNLTDPVIIELCEGKKSLHVNQGYTRCNLLQLTESSFLTSDKGIEKALLAEGMEIMYVDPSPVVLKGQKHGFFPGCCGIFNQVVYIAGSLSHHHQHEQIRAFITSKGFTVKELYEGKLTDVGGILFL